MPRVFSILLLTLSLVACRREPLRWHTEDVAPLAYGEASLEDFITDTLLQVNPDSSLTLKYDGEVYSFDPSDYLEVPDTNVTEAVTIPFLALNVPPNVTFIDEDDDHYYDLGDAQLKQMRMGRGRMVIAVESPVTENTLFHFSLPGTTLQGVPLSTTLNLPAAPTGGTVADSTVFDLTGYLIDMRGSTGSAYNTLNVKYSANTPAGSDTVTITNMDSIKVTFHFQDAVPDHAVGFFGSHVIEDTLTVALPALQKLTSGQLDLSSISLDLEVSNGFYLLSRLNIQAVEGINSRLGIYTSLSHASIGNDININPCSGTWGGLVPSILQLTYDEANSNLDDLVGSLPDSILLAFRAHLNPLGNVTGSNDAFYPQSRLKVSANASVPLNMAVNQLIYTDTLEVDLDEGFLERVEIHAELENNLPVDITLRAFVLNEETGQLAELDGSIDLPAGATSDATLTADETLMQWVAKYGKIILKFGVDSQSNTITLSAGEKLKYRFWTRAGIRLSL